MDLLNFIAFFPTNKYKLWKSRLEIDRLGIQYYNSTFSGGSWICFLEEKFNHLQFQVNLVSYWERPKEFQLSLMKHIRVHYLILKVYFLGSAKNVSLIYGKSQPRIKKNWVSYTEDLWCWCMTQEPLKRVWKNTKIQSEKNFHPQKVTYLLSIILITLLISRRQFEGVCVCLCACVRACV